MKVQLVGKVTGLDRQMCEVKFNIMEEKLRAEGHEVVNPMKIVPAESSYDDAMRICLRSLTEVEAICMHPDWVDSKGARREVISADALNLKTMRL